MNMYQRICCVFVAVCLFLSGLSIPVLADGEDLQVFFNDQAIAFQNPPNIKDGHTLAPLRELSEWAGFTVEWKNPEILITNDAGTTILFTVGMSRVMVDGTEKMCPRAPEIVDGITYVPLRFLCESLGFRVVYNESTITITQDVNTQVLTPQLMETKTYFPIALAKRMPMDQNYVISPWSVKLLLATVANGAAGATLDQILEALNVESLDELNEMMGSEITAYGLLPNEMVGLTNSYWLNGRYSMSDTYQFDGLFSSTISNMYQNNGFFVQNKNITNQINAWISRNTGGNVKDLVTDSEFLSAFVNTFTFQAAWETPFDAQKTVKSNFVNRDGESVLVDFMRMECRQNYYEDSSMQMIELPYEGGRISMYIVLPKNGQLGYSLDAAFDRMQEENVLVSLPKFRAELNSDVSGALRSLVGNNAFTDEADFTNMFEDGNYSMKLGQVRQKNVIWVGETGTEITSATYMQQRITPVPADVTVFDAKHPFVFLIRDNTSEEILFIGEYAYAK